MDTIQCKRPEDDEPLPEDDEGTEEQEEPELPGPKQPEP